MKRTTSGPGGSRGVLTVAAAPAGDPAGAGARLGPALASADLIVAAHPAGLRGLAAGLGVELTGRVVTIPPDAGGRGERPGCGELAADPVRALVAGLLAGQDVLLVIDAGQPGGANRGQPGHRAVASDSLVAAAAQAGIRVTVVPGPSPIVTALVVSGLPSDRFVVEGFPSGPPSTRERRFAALAAERRTLVFSGSPAGLGQTLAELGAALGADRRAIVCRDLAVSAADVLRGTLGELAGQVTARVAGHVAGGTPGGQVTLVVAGAPAADAVAGLADAVAQVRARVRHGATTRDAVVAVAAATGLRRRELYNAATESARTAGSGER